MYVYIYIYIYTHMYACMHIYIYIYICISTHHHHHCDILCYSTVYYVYFESWDHSMLYIRTIMYNQL